MTVLFFFAKCRQICFYQPNNVVYETYVMAELFIAVSLV